MVHTIPLKNFSEQSYKVKIKTFGSSLVFRFGALFLVKNFRKVILFGRMKICGFFFFFGGGGGEGVIMKSDFFFRGVISIHFRAF